MSKLDKAIKHLGAETVSELESLSAEALNTRIVQAEQAMDQVAKELEANPKYVELKEQLSAVTAGKKEVNKRQKAIIQVCLGLLESKGESA